MRRGPATLPSLVEVGLLMQLCTNEDVLKEFPQDEITQGKVRQRMNQLMRME